MVAAKSPARGQSPNKRETMQGKRRRGGYDVRGKWGEYEGAREGNDGCWDKRGRSQRVEYGGGNGKISLRDFEIFFFERNR